MTDWLAPMQQTFEYYIVDPGTWKDVKRIQTITSATIKRDSTVETLGSASFDMDEYIGEAYIRTYLVTIQNGVKERHPLGTHLAQSMPSSFDGMRTSYSVDAYTPLMEVKENQPPLGYYTPKGENVMDTAVSLTAEHCRAPVVGASFDTTLYKDFVAETDDTWLSYISDMAANAKFAYGLDELGRILFEPKQDLASLQPVWTYSDDNSSILYPDISVDHDMFGIPNVVTVIYSDNYDYYESTVVNDDSNSPVSTVNRGRRIEYREDDPSLSGTPNQKMVDEYATALLKSLSTLECTVTYKHGYNDVRIGDCVRLNYRRSGVYDIKAKVTQQSINCQNGCAVSETAVFTQKLWG
jgi:hypothetical protein